MAKIKSVELTPEQRAALEKASRHGKSHGLRQRCRMVLLKAEARTSKDVAAQVGCCEVVRQHLGEALPGSRASTA